MTASSKPTGHIGHFQLLLKLVMGLPIIKLEKAEGLNVVRRL
jgi:hypothetical protein